MKRAILKITPDLLGHLFFNGDLHVRVTSGLPDDAKFIKAAFHTDKTFVLLYESSHFKNIPQGMPYPVLKPPTVNRISPVPLSLEREVGSVLMHELETHYKISPQFQALVDFIESAVQESNCTFEDFFASLLLALQRIKKKKKRRNPNV